MTKHTPKPWHVYVDDCGVTVGGIDTELFRVCGGSSDAEELTNARLIAAAPDMLDALAEAENALLDYVETIEKTGASLNYGRAVLTKIRAAIAKATGR